MEENTFYSSLDFQSSPYDPKWWLDPPSSSTISDDFAYACSHELQDKFSINSTVSMADHIYGPFPAFDDSFVDENDDCEFPNDTTSNWYIDDLFDQLDCLQKLPTQSVKSYLDEARSLLYALESAGGSLSESEFTNFLVQGLDDTLFKRVHVYYYLMNPSLNDLSTLIFGHEKMLQQFTSIPSIGTHPEELSSIVDIPNTLDVDRVLENTDIGITPSLIHPSSLLTDNLTLAVPTSCTSLKSELLSSLFFATNGYSHSHLNIFKVSFLICSSTKRMFSLDTSDISYLDGLMEFSKCVHGGLIQEVQESPYLLQVCKQPSTFQSYWLYAVLIMYAMFLFNLPCQLFVFSSVRGFIISLVMQLHGCSTTYKRKLRSTTFRLRGRIRKYSQILYLDIIMFIILLG